MAITRSSGQAPRSRGSPGPVHRDRVRSSSPSATRDVGPRSMPSMIPRTSASPECMSFDGREGGQVLLAVAGPGEGAEGEPVELVDGVRDGGRRSGAPPTVVDDGVVVATVVSSTSPCSRAAARGGAGAGGRPGWARALRVVARRRGYHRPRGHRHEGTAPSHEGFMNADDLIMISVDDHIAEPATMFDAHVPREVQGRGCRGRRGGGRRRAVVVRRHPGPQPRPQRRRREAGGGCTTSTPAATTRCGRVATTSHERVRDMNAGGQLAGLNFPNWTGFSRSGPEPGPRPRRQPGDDQGLQRLARRRVVRRPSRSASSRAACSRCSTSSAAAEEVHRLAAKGCHAVTFSENPEALNMPSIHSGPLGPAVRRLLATPAPCCAATSARRRAARVVDRRPGRAWPMSALGSAPPIYTLIELVWAHVLGALPPAQVLPHRGRHRLDPLLPVALEHVNDRHRGVDQPRLLQDRRHPRRIFREPHPVLLHQARRSARAACDRFNIDNVCWESDYPHSDGTWPTPSRSS